MSRWWRNSRTPLLKDAAEDVRAILDEQDANTQTNVVRLLAQRTMTAFPGVEGANLVAVLLDSVADRSDEVLESSADEAIGAVNAHLVHSEIEEDHLAGAFILGLRSNRDGAQQLVAEVLATDAATRPQLGPLIVSNADRVRDEHLSKLGFIAAELLTDASTASYTVKTLASLGRPHRLLDAAGDPLGEALSAAVLAASDEEQTDDTGPAERCRSALEVALTSCTEPNTAGVATFLLRRALLADAEPYWQLAAAYSTLVPAEALTNEVLDLLVRRAPAASYESLSDWLDPIPDRFAKSRDLEDGIRAVLSGLWEERSELSGDFDEHDEGFVAGLAAIERVQDPDAVAARTALAESMQEAIGSAPVNIGQAQASETEWGYARRFVDAGLVNGASVADTLADVLASMAAAPPQPPPNPPPLEPYRLTVTRWLRWTANHWGPDAGARTLEAVKDSPWMPDPGRQLLILQTSAATARRHPGFESPYSAAEVAKIADEHRFKVKDGVASWLEVHADDPEEAFDVLESFLRTDTAFASVEAGTLAYVDRLDAAQRLTLARLELERSESRRIRTEFLRAVRFGEVDDLMGADLIVTEYKRTGTNNDRRRDLLDAWHVLQVTSPTARTRLIDEVMLPMLADGGKTGLDP